MKAIRFVIITLLCAVAQGAWADTVDLSSITSDYTVKDGTTLTGNLTNNVKISIANNATVTLNNVNI